MPLESLTQLLENKIDYSWGGSTETTGVSRKDEPQISAGFVVQ